MEWPTFAGCSRSWTRWRKNVKKNKRRSVDRGPIILERTPDNCLSHGFIWKRCWPSIFLFSRRPQFVRNLSNLKPIHVHADGTASFELDMDLIEPSKSIFLYKVSLPLLRKFDKVGMNRCPSQVLLLFTTSSLESNRVNNPLCSRVPLPCWLVTFPQAVYKMLQLQRRIKRIIKEIHSPTGWWNGPIYKGAGREDATQPQTNWEKVRFQYEGPDARRCWAVPVGCGGCDDVFDGIQRWVLSFL